MFKVGSSALKMRANGVRGHSLYASLKPSNRYMSIQVHSRNLHLRGIGSTHRPSLYSDALAARRTYHAAPEKRLKYLLILDFEATCGKGVDDHEIEIIEFPTLLYDWQSNKIQATFHEYVRPVINPTLTPFCTDLTGITQETVDSTETFPVVWERFQNFMREHALLEPESLGSFLFVTCGNWDLNTMLPRQLEHIGATEYLGEKGKLVAPYDQWFNMKTIFKKHLGLRTGTGMAGMLRKLELELVGRHHSGIDDCGNMLRIIQKLRKDGWTPSPSLFPS